MLSLNDLRKKVDSPITKRFFAALKPEYKYDGCYIGPDLFKFGDCSKWHYAGRVCKAGDSFVLITKSKVLRLDKDYFVKGVKDFDYITNCLYVGGEIETICKAYYLDLNDVFENTAPLGCMGPHKRKLFEMFKATEKEWSGSARRIRKEPLTRRSVWVVASGNLYCGNEKISDYWGLIYKVGECEYVVRYGHVYDMNLEPVEVNLLDMGPLQVVGVFV